MYNNFEKLNSKFFLEKEKQDEIFNYVRTLFEYLEKNELEPFGNTFKKVFGLSLDAFVFKKFQKYLSPNIKNKVKELRGMYNKLDPQVHQSILFLKHFSIRKLSLQDSYDDRPSYNQKIDVHEAKTTLKYFWLLLKWMRIKINNDNDEEIQNISYKNEKSITSPIETKEFKNLKNNNDDITVKTNTYAQLIMSHNYRFSIPVYQRDYTWLTENMNKLENDLLDRFNDKNTHYFGALAIAMDKKNKLLKIIDGQQRITTSILIFKCFYDFMMEKDLRVPEELENFMLKKIGKIYINQDVLTSQKSITRILKNRFVKSDKQLDKKAWNNMVHFKNFLIQKYQENIDIVDLYRTFAQNFESAVLYFDTKFENEMDIFKNLNTGGTQLKDWDLIRNFLFSKLKDEIMLENEEEINRFINNKFLVPLNTFTKNKSDSAIEEFFTIYLRYEFIYKNNKIFSKKGKNFPIYENFKKIWNINNGTEKITSFEIFKQKIEKIEKILSIYIELKYAYKKERWSKLNPYSHKIDLICNKVDFIPIIIKSIFDNCSSSDDRISELDSKTIELIEMIESYLIKSNAYGNNMSSVMDTFLLKNKKNKKTFNESFWNFLKNETINKLENDEWLKEMIKMNNIKPQLKTNILINLEYKINTLPMQKIKDIDSIERIIPQKIKFSNYDDKSISKEEFNDLHSNNNNHLGNLLILTKNDIFGLNQKLFLEKKQLYEAYGLANNNIKKVGLMNLTKFTYEDVKKRTEALADYIIESEIYYQK